MSIKDIIEEINRLSDKEVKALEEETDKEVHELKKKHEKVIESKKEEIRKRVENRSKELREGIVTRARLDMRNRLLTEKQALVSKLFDNALEKIKTLEKQDYLNFFSNFLKKSDIPEAEYKLLKVENDKNIDSDFVSSLKEKTGLKIAESDESVKGEGGFVLKAEYLELDFRLESVLKTVRLEKESEIVKVLFN